ncbi:MAG: MmgE/PrpD family protein [Candidatus Rokubacteria bacterium]|nr:MmgE/PrpD family protein [Candidatus Rokubacteria bacterium]
MTDSPTAAVARFVAELDGRAIPSRAIALARTAFVDVTATTLAGAAEPVGRIVTAWVREAGGAPRATVVGGGFRTSTTQAALANGTLAHALLYEDTTFVSMAHSSVVLAPAILALAEPAGVSGRTVLEAYVLGYDVLTRLGRALNPTHYEKGWHATVSLGTVAAAAAAARILALDADRVEMALGIAASMAGGSRQQFGTMTMPLHAGQGARAGVVAAELAGRGVTADRGILESRMGFCALFAGMAPPRLEPLTDGLGEAWEIERAGYQLKPYPCGAPLQRAIDAILALRARHRIDPARVREIRVGVSYMFAGVLIRTEPRTGLEGKPSLEFCAAVAMLDGRLGLDAFTDARVDDPATRVMMARVAKYVDPALERGAPGVAIDPMGDRTTVTIALDDGQELVQTVRFARGSPENPMTSDELHAKYRDCTRLTLETARAEQALALLEQLEELPSVTPLMEVLRA